MVPHVVFATAFDHYAVQAFDVNAVDYVLKPFDKARIAKAIQRARQDDGDANDHDRAAGAAGEPARRVKASRATGQSAGEVAAAAAAGGRGRLGVCRRFEDGLISVAARDVEGTSNYRTLEELHAGAGLPTPFWRPHRSHLVNIHHIKEVVPWFKSSYMLKMSDKKQTELPVSRAQTKRLRELFKL